MWLTVQGTLIHPDEEVEPIVPVGKLVSELGCTFQWNGDDCSLEHPLRGKIEVKVVNSCPEVSREEALQLIEDLESPKDHKAIKEALGTKRQSELMFLDKLLETHPAFEEVPVYLKDRIVDFPATSWDGLLLNRRLRKRIKNQGCIVPPVRRQGRGLHPDEGDEGVWRGHDEAPGVRLAPGPRPRHGCQRRPLLDAAAAGTGWVRGRSGGRAELPHEVRVEVLRPARIPQALQVDDLPADDERKKVNDDDVMMFRMMLLYVVAQLT